MGSLRWDPTGEQLLSAAGDRCVKVWRGGGDGDAGGWTCALSMEHREPAVLAEWCPTPGKTHPPQLLCAT